MLAGGVHTREQVSAELVAGVLSLVSGGSNGVALEKALLGLIKPRLNSLQNQAYAMGHQTVLEESGPPRQDCRHWKGA